MAAPDAHRVWIDDRHPIFRRGMAACLGSAGFAVVGESAGLEPAPETERFDTLIFDADRRHLQVAVRLGKGASLSLVALVAGDDEQMLCDAVEAGVDAVLLRRDLSPPALIGSLRAVAGGSTTLPADLLPRLLDRAARGARNGTGALADREVAVLGLLAEGHDTRDVAEQLCYSERTVKNIVHDLLMKMNCRNRAHAVALATRQGLI
jgi:DNA-binding NarL/FixJ family response regulator